MAVLQNGVWTQETADATHQSSPNLAVWLANYLPNDTPVIDFGCGVGYYVHHLEQNGFEATGIEGFKLDSFLSKRIYVHDLTEKFPSFPKFSVISLEVGEHLPKSAQETFMNTLIDNCYKHLVLSWAEIGQAGLGHINCRSQEDVIQDVESRGFKLNKQATKDARNNIDDNCDWFRRTLLIFERK